MKPPEEPRPPGALRDPEKKGIAERVGEGAKECRQGCEQNERFCQVQCDGRYDACRG